MPFSQKVVTVLVKFIHRVEIQFSSVTNMYSALDFRKPTVLFRFLKKVEKEIASVPRKHSSFLLTKLPVLVTLVNANKRVITLFL